MNTDISPNIADIAASLADTVCDSIAADPANMEAHLRELEDLKLVVARKGMELEESDTAMADGEDLCWSLAQALPDFNADALYQKRFAPLSLAAAVFCGWLFGGLLSGLLNLIGLGGDILRALAIFGAVWLCEYLASNPRARRIMLAVLGLGGLARLGAALASGMARLTSFSAFRQLVFGAGARPNIFKSVWLLLGALFLVVFLSKKVSSLDISSFRASIRSQIEQVLLLVIFVFREIGVRELDIAKLKQEADSAKTRPCVGGECGLAQALLEIADSLAPDKRAYLLEKLAESGIETPEAADGVLIWNSAEHAALYDTIGLVKDGDRCRILRRASRVGDKITKGHVQRIEGGAGWSS